MPRSAIARVPRPFLSTAAAVAALLAAMAAAPSAADAAELLRAGTLSGQSDHVTTGKVTIERDGDRTFVVLHGDFSLDGAPSPTLGFSKGGAFDPKSEFAASKSLDGAQRYEVPRGLQISAYDAFTVWCSKFGVPLGSAALSGERQAALR